MKNAFGVVIGLAIFNLLAVTVFANAENTGGDTTRLEFISQQLDHMERFDYSHPDEMSVVGAYAPLRLAAVDSAPDMVDFGTEKDWDIASKASAKDKKGFLSFDGTFGEDSIFSNVQTEVGTEVSYFKYKEPGLMRDVGMFFGLNGALMARTPFPSASRQETAGGFESIIFRAEGDLSFGQVDYSSAGTGELDNIKDWMLEIRGLAGVDYEINSKIILTPYFGLGYRYLNDDTAGERTTTGHAGYEREANYYYSPLGAELAVGLDETWSLGLVMEYDIFWYGLQKSHLEDAVAGLDTLKNDQTEGYGYRGSLKLQHSGEKMDVILEPFYRFWKIEDSDIANVTYGGVTVGYGLEPENYTKQFGIRLSVRY